MTEQEAITAVLTALARKTPPQLGALFTDPDDIKAIGAWVGLGCPGAVAPHLRLLRPLTDDEAEDLVLVTKGDLDTAMRGLPTEPHPRWPNR